MKLTCIFVLTKNKSKMKITPTQSVLSGKNGTVAGVNALAASLERGAKFIAEAKINIEKSRKLTGCQKLTWAQYKKMLDRANAYMELSDDPQWHHRWFMVQLRILQAMTCPAIFWR